MAVGLYQWVIEVRGILFRIVVARCVELRLIVGSNNYWIAMISYYLSTIAPDIYTPYILIHYRHPAT